jgi:hypothetical protein
MNPNTIITRDTFIKRFTDLGMKKGSSGLPKDETDQHILLKSMVVSFGPSTGLSEQQVNEKLAYWLANYSQISDLDHVTLRRRLVDTGYLIRSSDGTRYEVSAAGPYLPTFEPPVEDVNLAEALAAGKAEIERRKQAFMAKK